MPIYAYACACGNKFDRFLKLRDYQLPQPCTRCGGVAKRKITAPAIFGDWAPYTCPVTGKLIEGRRAHEENLKRTGCRLLEPGERQEKEKARAAADKALEDRIEATVEELVTTMPSHDREHLFNEAVGTTLNVTRESPHVSS